MHFNELWMKNSYATNLNKNNENESAQIQTSTVFSRH